MTKLFLFICKTIAVDLSKHIKFLFWAIRPSLRCAGRNMLFFGMVIMLGGCAAVSAIAPAADLIMTMTGLKKPDGPPPDREIQIRVIGAEDLNLNEQKQALSVVLKLYRLKDNTAFNQLTPDVANSVEREKAFFKAELIEAKEQLLIPRQEHIFKEKIPADVQYIGIAGMFRAPNPKRWKVAIPVAEIDKKTPLTVGVHACTISISDGIPPEKNPAPINTLAMFPCK
jgi:type VI secretion system protein VasD